MQAVTLNGLIAAGDGDDFLTAVFALNDFITGSTGNDTLHGFAGNDTLNGGKGDDVFHVDDNKDVVVESLTFAAGGGIDLVISKGTFTLGTNVDKLQLVDGKNADGTGNAIDNTLTGNSSDNKLSGLAGNDYARRRRRQGHARRRHRRRHHGRRRGRRLLCPGQLARPETSSRAAAARSATR